MKILLGTCTLLFNVSPQETRFDLCLRALSELCRAASPATASPPSVDATDNRAEVIVLVCVVICRVVAWPVSPCVYSTTTPRALSASTRNGANTVRQALHIGLDTVKQASRATALSSFVDDHDDDDNNNKVTTWRQEGLGKCSVVNFATMPFRNDADATKSGATLRQRQRQPHQQRTNERTNERTNHPTRRDATRQCNHVATS